MAELIRLKLIVCLPLGSGMKKKQIWFPVCQKKVPGKKKFVQIGYLLFEIWTKTCRKIKATVIRIRMKFFLFIFFSNFSISFNNFWTIRRTKMAGYFLEMRVYALFTLCYNIFCQTNPYIGKKGTTHIFQFSSLFLVVHYR